MRILVDMDDVVADLMLRFDDYLDTYGQAAAGIARYPERDEWAFYDALTDQQRAIIQQVWEQPSLFHTLKPTPGAKPVLNELHLMGHELWFVSTPHPDNRECAAAKSEWLKRNYGSWAPARLVLTHDKTIIDGDILIDDKPIITGARTPSWRRVVYDRPWNQWVADPRIKEWTMQEASGAIWQAVVGR